MLTADADLQIRTRLATFLYAHLHQLSDAFTIKDGKRILLQDSLAQVCRQELVDVITREAESGLRQVVGAEAKELSVFRDLISDQSGARQLDHGSDEIFNPALLLSEDFF